MAEYDLESWTSPDPVEGRRHERAETIRSIGHIKRLRLQQNSRKERDAFLWSLRCDGRAIIAGNVAIVTTTLTGGWLRRNGVPYSARTIVTECFDRFPGPDASEWFVVTTQVIDPEYLLGRIVTSSHFRWESDASKWSPKPCKPV